MLQSKIVSTNQELVSTIKSCGPKPDVMLPKGENQQIDSNMDWNRNFSIKKLSTLFRQSKNKIPKLK